MLTQPASLVSHREPQHAGLAGLLSSLAAMVRNVFTPPRSTSQSSRGNSAELADVTSSRVKRLMRSRD